MQSARRAKRVSKLLSGGVRAARRHAKRATVGRTPRATARRAQDRGVLGRSPLVLALASVGIAAASLSGPASALALPGRGHSFARSFGGAGEGDGQLRGPEAVAASETGPAAGDVYVVDAANNRVEQFTRDGAFVAVWGWGVMDGKREYEVCTSSCRAGIAGTHKYQPGPDTQAIAVDNSAEGSDPSRGDVYVATEFLDEQEQIDKFGPNGEPLEEISEARYEEPSEVERTEKEEREEVVGEELEAEETHGLTVAGDGTVWLYYEEDLYGLSDVSLKTAGEAPLAAEFELGDARAGLAIDDRVDFYVGHEGAGSAPTPPDVIAQEQLTGAESAPELHSSIEELDGEETTGVAVDQARGDVYLDNGTSLAELDQSGDLRQRFAQEGGEDERLHDGRGVAVNASSRVVYAPDRASGEIDVFDPEPAQRPRVDAVSVQDVSSQSAQLDAQIDPDGAETSYSFEYGTAACGEAGCVRLPASELREGPDEGFGDQPASVELGAGAPLLAGTTYHYRVVAENSLGSAASSEGAFSTLPANRELADQRAWEMVSPPDKGGAQVEPLTLEGAAIQAAADGAALAYVTDAPVGTPEGSRSLEVAQNLTTREREGWSSQDIVTPNERGAGLRLHRPPEYQLFTPNLALALVQPTPVGGPLAEPPLSPPASPQEEVAGGQEKTIYLRADSPLSPEAAGAANYAAARRNGELMSNPGYLALVTDANVIGGAQFGEAIEFLTATPDLGHIVIKSSVPLSSGSAPAPGENLYEWSDGALQLISVLPGPERIAASSPSLGASNHDLRHAISRDGSRVFWSAESHLYMRDTQQGETIEVDELQPGGSEASPEHPAHALFQGASSDGERVFFTDEQQLVAGSGARRGRPDLYVCEVVQHEGRPDCETTDLTPQSKPSGESADVQAAGNGGGVLGQSEDGSYVYFVANGVLSGNVGAEGSQASSGDCRTEPQRGAACNLYVAHHEGAAGAQGWTGGPQFIASLSNEDMPDWQGVREAPDLGELTSRVSQDGRYLAFMSEQRLTGYDNRVTDPAANEAPAQEIYLYHATSHGQNPVCVSCDPSGARPRGVLDPPQQTDEGPEGLGLLVDRPRAWEGKWLAANLPGWTKIDALHALYQSRYLSDSGRLFFDSPDALVAQDVNGKEDVYEYEPQGVPQGQHQCTSSAVTFSPGAAGCIGLISSGTSSRESAFLDASETGGEAPGGGDADEGGGDVFFVTAEKLVPQDVDGSFDAYDAHECTHESPCSISPTEEPPTACEASESCRPFSGSPPEFSAPATGSPAGSGNVAGQPHGETKAVVRKAKPLTRAQRLARALKSCRRLKHKRKRRACEASARKRYGLKKSAQRSSNSRARKGHA